MGEAILAIAVNLTLAMMANEEATMIFAGDAMMHQAQIDAARRPDGSYDYSECFAPLESVIKAADYAVVNLETPLGARGFSGYPCFCAPVSYASALKDAGFDLFLNANNHTLDRHDSGLVYTVNVLDSLAIPHIGTYLNASDRSGRLPFVADVRGFKVGFLNYTYGTNGIEIRKDVVVDYIDRRKISEDIMATRKAGAEVVVVAIHWGTEYVLSPVESQRRLADFLVSEGVDLVVGGHPHVVEPIDVKVNPLSGRKVPVIYSLGNFISNMRTRDTRGGAIAKVTLRRDSLGNAVVGDAGYEYVFTVPPASRGGNFVVYPIDSVPAQWRQAAADFRRALK